MRCMKISTALLTVPVCVLALACETDTATEESLVAPPGPSFKHEGAPALCAVSADVVQKVKGHRIVVTGTDGNDNIGCAGASLPVHISTGKGNDFILGSQFDDEIKSGKDCDFINALGGNDHVDLGPGDDSQAVCQAAGIGNGGARGGNGNDVVKGGPGDDELSGSAGSDLCEGGKGADVYLGGCTTCSDPDQDCTL